MFITPLDRCRSDCR